MPTFETLPRFERDWKHLTAQQQATFRKVITDAFVPDLAAPDRPFRPGLRVKGVTAHPGVFEMTWDNDGRATFSYGEERITGQPHVIWRRIGTHAIFSHRLALASAMRWRAQRREVLPNIAASLRSDSGLPLSTLAR